MRVWKQRSDDHRTTRNTGRGLRKVTLACDYRHLLRMALNDRAAASMQLAARWSIANVGFVNSSASAAPWIACKSAFKQDPLHGKPSTAASAMSSGA
ncbi:uncharacterized protein TNCV_1298011 [Trichonephila clavipes]|nr:uncharacterized protein TNCV_1298011 [Trichonephila clavipes]